MRFGILLVAGLAFAQTQPQFEVATIKPSAPQPIGHTSTRMDSNRERLNYSYVNLKEVIGQAYKVRQYQITGPDWLETERFDITAKLPAAEGSSRQVALMLQALLADRFKMAIHRETKVLPVYALVAGRSGPKLKSSESDSGISSNSNRTSLHVTAKATMQRFAEFLSEEVGRPVIDRTGLTGPYDFTIDWAVDNAIANDSPAGPSIFTALQEQLGLKLDSTKGPVEIIVVDHADRTPSEN
jgi:uncharacterized protein (TIGR03435 family)